MTYKIPCMAIPGVNHFPRSICPSCGFMPATASLSRKVTPLKLEPTRRWRFRKKGADWTTRFSGYLHGDQSRCLHQQIANLGCVHRRRRTRHGGAVVCELINSSRDYGRTIPRLWLKARPHSQPRIWVGSSSVFLETETDLIPQY